MSRDGGADLAAPGSTEGYPRIYRLTPLIEPLLVELPDWAIWLMLAFFGVFLRRLLLGREI